MMRPCGDVIEMLFRVDGGLGDVGVGARQPVGGSGKCAEIVFDEVEDKVAVENRMLLLKRRKQKGMEKERDEMSRKMMKLSWKIFDSMALCADMGAILYQI